MPALSSIEIEHNMEDLFGLFDSYGDEDYLGEPVSKKVHCIQCGMLAERAGAAREVCPVCTFAPCNVTFTGDTRCISTRHRSFHWRAPGQAANDYGW